MFFNVTDSAQITYPKMLALEAPPGSDFGVSGVPETRLMKISRVSIF